MTKEQYNSLGGYQKEMYDKCNKGNKGALIAGWIFGAIIAIIVLIAEISAAISSRDVGGFGGVIAGILMPIIIGATLGGIFPGFAHLGFLFKKIKLDTAILLILLIGIFILMVYAIIFSFIMYSGWVFLIIDTVLFIRKKPLIYGWEDSRVLAKAETKAGAYIAASSAPSAADQLNELDQLLNSGLITQEEFDAKKSEIMSRL